MVHFRRRSYRAATPSPAAAAVANPATCHLLAPPAPAADVVVLSLGPALVVEGSPTLVMPMPLQSVVLKHVDELSFQLHRQPPSVLLLHTSAAAQLPQIAPNAKGMAASSNRAGKRSGC
mmetsp:Transcript_3147/g.9390  ORF Transcript_3147/g.9390 Transcript_3147/m.9390 type:complete len:119 (+) Transcript_3147:343-699(+)